jgi:hypothetical protein
MGLLFKTGEGVEQNLAAAAFWWRKAANQDHPQAQYNLGLCYARGVGMAYDAKEAFYWFKRAAELGLPEAQNGVAFLYATGQGVPKNVIEAYAYYNLSVPELEITKTNLTKLKSEMTADQINSGIRRSAELRNEVDAKNAAKKAGK